MFYKHNTDIVKNIFLNRKVVAGKSSYVVEIVM